MTKQVYESKAVQSGKMAVAAQGVGDDWLVKFHSGMQAFWLSMAAMKS